METLDLHPEELFDKAHQGLASSDELARLDAHLALCATCRFDRQVRLDFDSVGGSMGDLDDLVARALSGAQQVPAAPRRRVGPLLIAAMVGLMGFGSFAAVAQFTGLLPKWLGPRSEVVVTPRAQRLPAPAQVREVPRVEEPLALTPALSPAGEREKVAVVVRRAAPIPVALPLVVEPDAIAVFTRATQARVRGETATAMADFLVVIARFPTSPEAALSQAALGRMRLDRGEAASALEAFDAYLATNEPLLREDVQGARAMALQSLGRVEAERSAWEAVLHDYPEGVYAPRARSRLESLSP